MGTRALGRPKSEVDREIQMRTAEHIFELLGELKGCATKPGQLLAIYELAPPPALVEPYKIALSRLQDSAPAMLSRSVHAAMAASMGENWRWYFRDFDGRRAAAASPGTLHGLAPGPSKRARYQSIWPWLGASGPSRTRARISVG